MLLNKSPVRSISEKLKSPQASIKDMKIERKKDFRSFLKYIERESKELEKIKLPSRNEVTKKSGSGGIGALLGFGALGLLGLLGGMGGKGNQYKYGDKSSGNIFKGPYVVGRDRKGGDDDLKTETGDLPFLPKSTFLGSQFGSVNAATLTNQLELDLNKKQQNLGKKTVKRGREAEYESSVINEKKRSKKTTVEQTVGGGSKSTKSSTVLDAPTYRDLLKQQNNKSLFGDSVPPINKLNALFNLPSSEPVRIDDKNFKSILDMVSGKTSSAELDKKIVTDRAKLDVESTNFKDAQSQRGLFGTRKFEGFKNFKRINSARFITGTKIRRFFKNDFSKPTLGINTMEGMFSKLGLGKKTNLFKSNPKGVNMFKLGTFSKGKTGFMVLDFGLAAYDLFSSLRKVTPRDNIGASLLDLVGININNFVADMLNNPGMLREYVSVSNDPNMINVNKNREIINENIRKIKELKKEDFTGGDINEGAITGKQMMENLRKTLSNPKTYNPFSTYNVKPNPDLFTRPGGDPNDDVLSIFQSQAMEAN